LTDLEILVSSIRSAAKSVEDETGYDPCVALALDVVGLKLESKVNSRAIIKTEIISKFLT
jgi:hypothetical protein